MAAEDREKIVQFRKEVQGKIEKLLTEFANGKVSREQFHALYAHQSMKLQMAEEALRLGDATMIAGAPEGQTISIRQSTMGKALGVMIYHNKTGMFVDTLGAFDVPPALISPILNDFSTLMDAGRPIDRRVEKVGEKQWLLFAAGRYTTIVSLFHNEPSPEQSREMERLHYDFEVANANMLAGSHLDKAKLAYPFTVFIQQKMKRS
jgi:hypothetical protein